MSIWSGLAIEVGPHRWGSDGRCRFAWRPQGSMVWRFEVSATEGAS